MTPLFTPGRYEYKSHERTRETYAFSKSICNSCSLLFVQVHQCSPLNTRNGTIPSDIGAKRRWNMTYLRNSSAAILTLLRSAKSNFKNNATFPVAAFKSSMA